MVQDMQGRMAQMEELERRAVKFGEMELRAVKAEEDLQNEKAEVERLAG